MVSPARTPPDTLPGLHPEWSRLVTVPGRGTFHVLERPADEPKLTVLAVHGNPTWSYLWRNLVAAAPESWRVIAVDQLGMGYSERLAGHRTLAERIDDLDELTKAMDVRGPVVTVAHDWGGPVSLGWALRNRDLVRGIVLTNTAVHQPANAAAPALIRLSRWAPLRRTVTEQTPAFVRGTTLLSPNMPREVAEAFAAPYRGRDSRAAVGDFVADIPLEPDHPSADTLAVIAESVSQFCDVPVLLAWGTDDPVFSERYLRDLMARVPTADVHRYEKARHLVTEDAPGCIGDIITWIQARVASPVPASPAEQSVTGRIDDELRRRAQDQGVAIAELSTDRRVSWATLAARTDEIAAGMRALGIAAGDRIAVLVPPSADLIAVVYAAWRIGAVVVAVDAGLGPRGILRALRGAHPDHAVGAAAGLALTRALSIRGCRILAGVRGPATAPLAVDATLAEVARLGRESPGRFAGVDDTRANGDAVIAFTSGATGPAKGVVYTHARLMGLIEAIRRAYSISGDGPDRDALVAAFAPWAVLGPALGIASAIPDMRVTDATSLTATAVARAAAAVGGTIMWASPAAMRSIVATGPQLDATDAADLRRLRLVLVAGAPVPPELLRDFAALSPGSELATPYGMTEALPLTRVSLEELLVARPRDGVLVGRPLEGVDIAIAALDPAGRPAAEISTVPEIVGEIVIKAPWMRERYDRLWATQFRADNPPGWHRTGDVGRLDADGRLWVQGRLAHVITTATGPITPVGAELVAQRAADVLLAACVGIGPTGTQVPVIVLQRPGARIGLADLDLTIGVRDAVAAECGIDVVAVLTMRRLPVDVRHRSKIDRATVAREASAFLAGGRE